MEKSIDIYSRLLIATITFVVPILINLLSTFTEGERRRMELSKKVADDLDRAAVKKIQSNPENTRETISENHKKYKENEIKTNKELSLLNPLNQFWKIFSALSSSFLFLIISYFIRSNYWNLYNHSLSIIILISSVISYLVGLFLIIRIMHTISKTKKIIDNSIKQKNMTTQQSTNFFSTVSFGGLLALYALKLSLEKKWHLI